MTRAANRSSAAALTATLGVAALAWIVIIRLMSGKDTSAAMFPGSLGAYLRWWVPMMAAMMLPGALPAVLRRARDASVRAVLAFVGSYLCVWIAVGIAVYAAFPPQMTTTTAAGALVIAAGLYELTSVKRYFRSRCRADARTGFGYGLSCLGSSGGLMSIPVVFGMMNVASMAAIAGVVLAQKLVPPNAVVDASLALAVVGLGIAIVVAPSAIPGLMPPMRM